MPTIFYKTFPATAPVPLPNKIAVMNKSFTLASSSSSSSSTPVGLAHTYGTSTDQQHSHPNASPTSVIGQIMPSSSSSSHHRRDDSLQGFVLEGNEPQVEGKSTTYTATSNKRKSCGGDNEAVDEEWVCPISAKARRTKSGVQDAIRPIASKIQMGFQRIDRKDPISLASADSSLAHIPPCTKAMEAVVKATLYKPHGAGYTHHCGSVEARRAVALHHSSPEYQLGPDHVIVTNGCSGALDLILETLLDEGSTLLVPNPGFPLYQELAEKHGAKAAQYRLDPNKRWECDLLHLEEIMSSAKDVRALVINNPSSPTGSVFSERHLEQILSFAFRHRLPIVTDEVYGTLTFGTNQFHPMAQIAARYGRQVPIISASGLSKQFMVPGWRVGWLTFQDNTRGSLRHVEQAAQRLMQLQHGVNQLAQAAIAPLLSATTPGLAAWKEKVRSTLERQGMLLCSGLNDVHCLKIAPAQGAMYAICHIHLDKLNSSTIRDDIEFASKLVEEENVFVLPGSTFGVPGTFRVAYSASEQTLEEATNRIANFCQRHSRVHYNESYGFPNYQ
eukprot:CAMPEP_0113453122 /NCGR_PEP_ID=MMETSP0014_2-20120614/7197_1 /TAXON_ID=2857 /ORGANISM="Nitzschia sp." /LENGTH=558 /DNA_ID=CAMNT_0000344511 /DNA_START=111 /DNA_END=1787 /DNA_ORIENTATION=+ /assembly_acc=CAM_ASM_000159